jgi:integrase
VDLDAGQRHIGQAFVSYGAAVREFKEPKTATSRRDLPFDPRAVAALRRFRKLQTRERRGRARLTTGETELVFVDEIGDRLRPDRIWAAFRRLAKEAGLPRLTLNGLRHTFATLGLEAGGDVL